MAVHCVHLRVDQDSAGLVRLQWGTGYGARRALRNRDGGGDRNGLLGAAALRDRAWGMGHGGSGTAHGMGGLGGGGGGGGGQ